MDRFALMVDAGYFFAAGAAALVAHPVKRHHISLTSPKELSEALVVKSAQISQIPNSLRVYWYDALSGPRLSQDQQTLAHLAGVKVRLGSLNTAGEQKGVDSLIVTDLIELARNGAITDAIVVSGDEDLRIAFQIAQSYGVRVHILSVGDSENNVSRGLIMEADSVDNLDATWLAKHLTIQIPRAIPVSALLADSQLVAAGPQPVLAEAVQATIDEFLTSIGAPALKTLSEYFDNSKEVPPEHDRPLIAKVSKRLGGQRLTGTQMRQIRGMFITAVRAATATA